MKNYLSLHPKVAAPLLASWISTIVVFALHQWAGIDLPGTVDAALVGVIAFVAGWLAPSQFGP